MRQPRLSFSFTRNDVCRLLDALDSLEHFVYESEGDTVLIAEELRIRERLSRRLALLDHRRIADNPYDS